jgi:hypothetical protein
MIATRVVVLSVSLALAAAALRGGEDVMAKGALGEPSAFVQVDAQAGTQGVSGRHLGVRGDFTVQGTLKANTLTSPIGDVSVSGSLNVMGTIEAGSAKGAHVKVESVTSVQNGISSKEDQLLVLGKIDADSVTTDTVTSSFLEIDGEKQWSLVTLEDFEEETEVEGWSQKDITECAGQKFLGGPCTKAGDSKVTKTFTNLPPHTQLRVAAKYLFIDSWDGESAFMSVDGRHVWADTYNHASIDRSKALNVCGNETPEGRLMRNIDVTVPHTEGSFELTFGATTDEHSCDESFGVDSVMIFVR